MQESFETPRLLLRPFQDGDTTAAFAWLGHREVMRYAPNGPDRSVARTRVRLQRYQDHQRAHGFSRWLVLDRESGRPLGDAGIMHQPGTGEIQLGCRMAPAWCNRGLATEACEAWLHHALKALGLPRLLALAHPENGAAQRVLEKLEFSLRHKEAMVGMNAREYSLCNPLHYRPFTTAVLETPRLRLREMGMGDLDFLTSLLAHPEVMRYYTSCCTGEESESWLRRQLFRYARYGFGFWLVIEKATNRPVGQAGVLLQEVEGKSQVGLGYMLDRPFWGRGFALESAVACRDYVFDKLRRSRLWCLVRPENVASLSVARRLGLVVCGSTQYDGFTHRVFTANRPPCTTCC